MIHDLRKKDFVRGCDESDKPGKYLIVGHLSPPPQVNDLFIDYEGKVMIFDWCDGEDDFSARVTDTKMEIKVSYTPSYRALFRAVRSQARRKSFRKG